MDKRILADLKNSGLTPRDIKVSDIVNGRRPHYLIPYPGANGFHRAKFLDGVEPKYLQPAKTEPHVFWPENFDWDSWRKEAPRRLFIPEGEKKAACGCKFRFATIGLGGLWNFQSARTDFIDDLAALDWENIIVYIVPDYDVKPKTRAHNGMAVARLTYRLQERKAAGVFVVDLKTDGTEKVGMDDFLVNHGGAEAFQVRVDNARPGSVYDIRDTYFERPMAEAFVAEHRDRIRYLSDRDCWMAWSEGRWRRNEGVIKTLLGEYLKNSMPERPEAKEKEEDEKEWASKVKAVSAIRKQLCTARFAEAVLKLASEQSAIAAESSLFDSNPDLLGIPDGKVVELRTGTVRPAAPEDFISRSTAVAPSDEECPLWLKTAREILGSEALIEYIHRCFGYFVTGHVNEESWHLWQGSGGNGKGTLIDPLRRSLGDAKMDGYATGLPMETLYQKGKFINDYSIQNDIAGLQGARLVVTDEADKQRPLDSELIKKFTGKEHKLTGKRMRENKFDFTPTFKLLSLMNHKPIVEVDDAMKRRLHYVHLTNMFTNEIGRKMNDSAKVADVELKDRLYKEEGAAILGLVIRSAVKWYEKGLVPPPEVIKNTKQFFETSDPFAQWIEEREHEVGFDHFEPTTSLYRDWNDWARRNNITTVTIKVFTDELDKRPKLFRYGKQKVLGKQARGYAGIRLNIHS